MDQPRSIRTFNPGAMNYGPFARKHGAIGTDGRLAIFPDEDTGYKAMSSLLDVYGKRGQNTVSSIIGGLPTNPNLAWAPRGVDNNSTDTYIQKVASKLGIAPDTPITPELRPVLMRAMAEYEAGVPLGSVPRPTSPAQPQASTQTGQPAMTPYTGATPDDVSTQRKMAQALMGQGMSTEPVGHWTQALARVLQGGVGGMYQAQAKQGEQQGNQSLAQALSGGTPTASSLVANPWTRDLGMKVAQAQLTAKPDLTTGQREYQTAKQQGFPGTFLEYQTALSEAKRPTTNVTVNGDKEGAKVLAKRLGERVEIGDQSRKMKGDLSVLSDLSTKIGTVGATGDIMNALGPYASALGIKIEGLSDFEAFSSVVSRLAPTMRPPGSGATSDFEFKQFLNSLPKLSQTTEGRQKVLETLNALSDYNIAVADISEKALAGEIDRAEATRMTRALGNPMQMMRKNNPGLPDLKAPAPAPPKPGDVYKGHRFKGGDPSKPENWEVAR
jgi:hypothetical protein